MQQLNAVFAWILRSTHSPGHFGSRWVSLSLIRHSLSIIQGPGRGIKTSILQGYLLVRSVSMAAQAHIHTLQTELNHSSANPVPTLS